jgi:GxxExxY protein
VALELSDAVIQITRKIIGAGIAVHRALGPGLLESAYQACLVYELQAAGCRIEMHRPVPLVYGRVRLDCGYRLDLVVDGTVIVELKSIAELAPIHTAQAVTYLKLTGYPVCLLINFNVSVLAKGVRRVVHPEIRQVLRGGTFPASV